MAYKGQLGATTSLHKTPARLKRERKRRQREDREWKARNGEVKSYIDPSIIKRDG